MKWRYAIGQCYSLCSKTVEFRFVFFACPSLLTTSLKHFLSFSVPLSFFGKGGGGGVMVNMLDEFRIERFGSSTGKGFCIVFLDKILYSRWASIPSRGIRDTRLLDIGFSFY